MYEKDIEIKARELPEFLRKQVLDFMDFLSSKYKSRGDRPSGFSFEWEDGLSDIEDKTSSVDLQHRSQEWR
jgi:hypothetical protein